MTVPEIDRRDAPERRLTDRRMTLERRVEDAPVPIERRQGGDRRKNDRRLGIERRLALNSAAAHMQAAMDVLARLAEAQVLSDEHLRLLDAAMLRLRFAIERMSEGAGD